MALSRKFPHQYFDLEPALPWAVKDEGVAFAAFAQGIVIFEKGSRLCALCGFSLGEAPSSQRAAFLVSQRALHPVTSACV